MKKLFIVFFLLLGACSGNEEVLNNTGEFSIENISTSEFENNESYFIVMPLSWSGSHPAIIESINLVKRGEEPLTLDADRIAYEFSGASVDKENGVYAREDIGEIEEINGFEVRDEAKLVLEISMMNVSEDSERKLQIIYTTDGEGKEQIIESPTFQNLSTQQ